MEKICGFKGLNGQFYKTENECIECGSNHFNADHRQTIAQIDDIIDFFHQYKKGNLTKIPKQNL